MKQNKAFDPTEIGFLGAVAQAQLGQDVTLREFPGVRHAFDNPCLTVFTLVSVPGRPVGASAADCAFVELPDSEFVNSETGQQFTWSDPCVRLDGGSLGDSAARAQALREITTFFHDILQ